MRRTKVINQIVYILLLIPLMKPESFNQIPILDRTFNVLMVGSSLIILLLYISKNNKIDRFIIVLVGYLIIPGFWPTPVAVQRTLTAVQII